MKSPGFSLFFVKYSLILEKAADGAACWWKRCGVTWIMSTGTRWIKKRPIN